MFSLKNIFRVVSSLLIVASFWFLIQTIQEVHWWPIAAAVACSTLGTFGFILTHPAEWGH